MLWVPGCSGVSVPGTANPSKAGGPACTLPELRHRPALPRAPGLLTQLTWWLLPSRLHTPALRTSAAGTGLRGCGDPLAHEPRPSGAHEPPSPPRPPPARTPAPGVHAPPRQEPGARAVAGRAPSSGRPPARRLYRTPPFVSEAHGPLPSLGSRRPRPTPRAPRFPGPALPVPWKGGRGGRRTPLCESSGQEGSRPHLGRSWRPCVQPTHPLRRPQPGNACPVVNASAVNYLSSSASPAALRGPLAPESRLEGRQILTTTIQTHQTRCSGDGSCNSSFLLSAERE